MNELFYNSMNLLKIWFTLISLFHESMERQKSRSQILSFWYLIKNQKHVKGKEYSISYMFKYKFNLKTIFNVKENMSINQNMNFLKIKDRFSAVFQSILKISVVRTRLKVNSVQDREPITFCIYKIFHSNFQCF